MQDEQSVITGTPAATGTSPSAPLVTPRGPQRDYFARRFLIVYASLGVILVVSVAGLLVFGARVGFGNGHAWSAWRPSSGSVATMAKQIADHFAPNYHLANGRQIVAIVPSAPNVTSGTDNIAIAAVAVRGLVGGNTNVDTITSGRTEMYTLCGLGTHCSIASGKSTFLRGQLVRREGLETALYTFKYVPKIDSVIMFMPPAQAANGTTPITTVLYYQKQTVAPLLAKPLRQTLPLVVPPRANKPNRLEGVTIDEWTLPFLYESALTQLQAGGALLVLTPVEPVR
jgi:hypothetical protein